MLEKQHKVVDPGPLKCWKSSTMKFMTHIKASCTRDGGFLLIAAFAAIWLSACTSLPVPAPPPSTSSSYLPPRSSVDRSDSKPLPPKAAEERPGLATGFGESTRSQWNRQSFVRASSKPAGTGAIYYNNREGIDAMTGYKRKVSGMQTAAGDVIEWGVKGGFGFLPTYSTYSSSRRFVVGNHGSNYSIVLKNRCKSRLEVVLSVDGLDVIDGKPASFRKRGYVVAPGEALEVKGWRTGWDSVARFEFSSVGDSYSNRRHGTARNVGVIGLAVFGEKGVDPWKWMPDEVRQRQTASPFATAP